MQPKGTGKRGRPKRKIESDEQSNQSFSKKPVKKLKAASKKNLQTKKLKLSSRPSKSKVEISSLESFSDSDDENSHRIIKVPLEIFNADQIFADILNKASREPEYLMMLRNLLSGSSRLRDDKVNQFKKKWKSLKNSNCSQQEYFSRQSQLKRAETEELGEIEEDIFTKLAISNIQGFDTKQSIISEFRQKHREANQSNIDEEQQFVIENGLWAKYRQQQKKLLEMLMKEADLVSQDYKLINVTHSYSSQPLVTNTHASHTAHKEEENQMDLKFNSLETQQNPQATQFLFCKHFSDNVIDYDRVFSNGFKVSEQEKFYVDSKAMSWLLESKCDEIYTNERFQKQTYEKYTKILKQIYEDDSKFDDGEIMDKILESAAYVLNSVHYYQKFKLKCELLHPLDLLLVVQKLSEKKKERERKAKLSGSGNKQENKESKMQQEKQVGEIMNFEEERY